MLLINITKLPQIVDVPTSIFPVTIYPGMVFDPAPYRSLDKTAYKEFEVDMFRGSKHVGLIRNYALGDLLQLIAVARYFKDYYKIGKVSIFTTYYYCSVLRPLFKDIHFECADDIPSKFDGILFNLNGTLERDHSLFNSENSKHRVEIYLNTFGIGNINKNDLDWNPTKLNVAVAYNMDTKLKKIGLQIRGSGKMKTLKPHVIKKITERLTNNYCVVLLDGDASVGFDGKNIINTCGKLNVYQVVATLTKLDCCITMDSGMLWMAHAAKCPVLTILGPTREEERISLHPLYPEKAKSISISEMIGCKPCFETMIACNRTYKCMNEYDEELLVDKIESKIKEIIGD